MIRMTFEQVRATAKELGVIVQRIPAGRKSWRGYEMWKAGDGSIVSECKTLEDVRNEMPDFIDSTIA